MRARRILLALVTILVVAMAVRAALNPDLGPTPSSPIAQAEAAEVTLEPAVYDPAGFDPSGDLVLSSRRPLALAAVEAALKVEPAVELRVEQADREGMRFRITPSAALEPDRIYRFRLGQEAGLDRDYQWSFQTRAEFRLLGTLPAHRSTGVPVNTGIELVFSHDDFANLADYVSIDPPVEGRWERHKKTAVFVPREPLEPGTVYTVTLKEGLGRTRGDGRLGAYTFAFETAVSEDKDWSEWFQLLEDAAEFATDVTPYFRVWDDGADHEYTIQVYRYPDAAAYAAALRDFLALPAWSSAAFDRYWEPTDHLEAVATVTATPMELNYNQYLVLPEPLPAGYYLAVVQRGDRARQIRFQVTDLSYYLAESTTGGLAWLNDLTTGRPAAGAALYLPDGSLAAIADDSGVARLDLPARQSTSTGAPAGDEAKRTGTPADDGGDEDVPYGFWIARSGDKEVVLHTGRSNWYWSAQRSQAELYWRYLYLDRAIYKPADTVHVWGIVHPRAPEARPVEAVRVEVTGGWYWREEPVLVKAELPVERSSFIGSLSLPNLSPGTYELSVWVGDERFASRWFEVATYAKPAYQIEVTPDRDAVFTGETVNFRVRATFFEGTPVPDMQLNYEIGGQTGSVTTDVNGEAVISYTPPHEQETWGWQGWLTIFVTGGQPEVGEVTAERVVRLFHRDVKGRVETAREGDQATVTVQVNQVVRDALLSGREADVTGSPVAGRPVEFTLIEHRWNRVAEGEYYDFIEKVVRPRYRHVPEQREIRRETVQTDGEGRAAFRFTFDPEGEYEVRYRVQDSRGLWLQGNAWVFGSWYGYDTNWGWPQLTPADDQRYRVPVGEPVEYVFRKGERQLDDRPAGFLFFTARRGIREHAVQDSPVFTVTLQAADLPNIMLYGVAFDGRSYITAATDVTVDPEEMRLDVTVTPDRAEYRPGDEVRVKVTVRSRSGQPAAGAVVNLNLVDEAVYAVREQYVDILGDLYGSWISSGVLRTRRSHEPPPTPGAAEKGGEGGGVRHDFRDAVLFTQVVTDGAGQAAVTFRVPHNLTSWRLTYQAVLPGTMEAGSGAIRIPVRQPFFADLVMGETYLVGERPIFQVRAYGEALAADARVGFEVEVEGPSGYRHRLQVDGRPFAPLSVPLAPLTAEGTYTVRVRATAGDLSDALERTFAVRQTHLVQNRVDFRLLEPGVRFTGAAEGLTYVTFVDWERGRYLDVLQRSRWLWGSRFEHRLARAVAAELLRLHFGWEDPWPEPELEALRYQTVDGSIGILPYSSGDLKLSALAADLAPERFDRAALAVYFRQVLEDEGETRERKAMALYGLAGLGEPVLLAAHQLLAEPNLTPREELYAMLAAAELGDLERVRPRFRRLVEAYSEPVGQDLRLTAGADRDEQLETTALAAALAAKLGEPEALSMLGYLLQNPPQKILVNLELVLAAQAGLEGLKGAPVGLTYRLNGELVKKTLQPGERVRLALRPEELASLEVTAVEGSVAAVVAYAAPGRPAVNAEGGAVARRYSPAPETWKPGDIVAVTLSYTIPADAPEGLYELTDTLPSGLRYLERPWAWGRPIDWSVYTGWALQVDGQRVTFPAEKKGRPIQYFACVVSAGEYRAEEAVLRHQQSGLVYGMSPAEAVNIGW